MTSTIFISASRSELAQAENDTRTNDLASSLIRAGYRVTEVKGCYQGTQERSLMLTLPINGNLLYLKNIAAVFQQESILRVVENAAELIYIQSGEHVAIGTLIKDVELPKGIQNYTEVPYMGSSYFLFTK